MSSFSSSDVFDNIDYYLVEADCKSHLDLCYVVLLHRHATTA